MGFTTGWDIIYPPTTKGRFLPQGYLDNWLSAVGTVASTPVTAMVLGASYEIGGTAVSDIYKTAWWPLFCKALVTKYGTVRYGDFFAPFYSSQWTTNSAPSGHAITFDLAPTTTTSAGPLLGSVWSALNNGVNPLCHYTHNPNLGYNNLSGDIVYFDPAGSTAQFTWNLNGGAAQTSPANTGAGIMKKVSWTSATAGWSASGNVVNIMTQTVANSCLIIGFSNYPAGTGPGSSGIGFAWCAASGLALSDLARTDRNVASYAGFQATAGQVDKLSHLGGVQTIPTTPPYTLGAFGFPFNPKLHIVGWFDDATYNEAGLNDPTGVAAGGPRASYGGNAYPQVGADPGQFRNGLARLRRMNMSNGINGSMLFALGNVPSGVFSDVALVGFLPQNYDAYSDAYYDVARAYQCGVIDHTTLWGERGLTLGYLNAGNPHPNDTGQAARQVDILSVC